MFHEALELREKGFSVVPIVPGTKAPPKDFPLKEFFTRRPTLGELRQWFSRETRNGIAVVTGQVSGIDVIDVESLDEGRELYNKLPKTPAIALTGKGVHFYYQTNEAIATRIKAKVQGVLADVKGEGGYVLAPPTLHPSGKQYEWIDPKWNLIDLPTFDPGWVEKAEPKSCDFKAPVSVPRSGQAITDLRAYCLRIPSIQGQNGSSGWFKIACKARDVLQNPNDVFNFMMALQAESPQIQPKWSEKDTWHKIADAFEKWQISCPECG